MSMGFLAGASLRFLRFPVLWYKGLQVQLEVEQQHVQPLCR